MWHVIRSLQRVFVIRQVDFAILKAQYPATIVANNRKVKTARVDTSSETHSDGDDKDLRLVFEIEYAGSLFDDYKPVRLDIWRAFADTTVEELIRQVNS